MYEYIRALDLRGKRCLVVGCGRGYDALALSKLGADAYAFDLSSEQLAAGKQLSEALSLPVHIEEMVAEHLRYPDSFFDLVLAVDIIHHCEIPQAVAEMRRVAKPGAVVVINEVYSHSLLQRIRESWFVDKCIYPLTIPMIYGGFRYVTEDERKINQRDLNFLSQSFTVTNLSFFEMFIKRIVPNRQSLAKLDTALLSSLPPAFGRLCGGRFVMFATNSRPLTASSSD